MHSQNRDLYTVLHVNSTSCFFDPYFQIFKSVIFYISSCVNFLMPQAYKIGSCMICRCYYCGHILLHFIIIIMKHTCYYYNNYHSIHFVKVLDGVYTLYVYLWTSLAMQFVCVHVVRPYRKLGKIRWAKLLWFSRFCRGP